MLISLSDLRKLITTDESDFSLAMRLGAIEEKIRSYTNNHFLDIGTRTGIVIRDGLIDAECRRFHTGDTVELCHIRSNDELCIIAAVTKEGLYIPSEPLLDSSRGTMTLVRYPKDVVMGAVQMLQYDLQTSGREDVASETISRHSVTYRDPSASASVLGYPSKITGFLKAYRRARV